MKKEELLELLTSLQNGVVDLKHAYNKLWGLVRVSGIDLEGNELDEIDIVRCKHCGSIDIIGDHKHNWCSDCGKTHRGGV